MRRIPRALPPPDGEEAEETCLGPDWPSGIRQSFAAVPANRLVTVDQIKGVVKSEAFPLVR
jgi:hypothetical protein